MNWKKMTMTVAVFLMGLSMTQAALAHRHSHGWHGNVGIYLAPPLLGWRYYPPPYYYPPAYYYPPPPVYVPPPQPPVYIERPPAEPVEPPQAYWYYCTDPEGYYPTVKECPGGWLKVLPQTEQTP
ncbi:MAG: hypothetical protein M0P70_03680 [Desulfobulbaceae bacterium]|nr:hypothetical protein [Desulfobulbaceae bacterium]